MQIWDKSARPKSHGHLLHGGSLCPSPLVSRLAMTHDIWSLCASRHLVTSSLMRLARVDSLGLDQHHIRPLCCNDQQLLTFIGGNLGQVRCFLWGHATKAPSLRRTPGAQKPLTRAHMMWPWDRILLINITTRTKLYGWMSQQLNSWKFTSIRNPLSFIPLKPWFTGRILADLHLFQTIRKSI